MSKIESIALTIAGAQPETATHRVWDPLIRVLHWTIVLGVGFTAYTGLMLGARWITPHATVGIVIGIAVLTRLVWGFVGTGPARFAAFLVGPVKLLEHLREMAIGRAERHLGHNPLGGWMILALLAVLTVLGVTGLLVWGGEFKAGPAKAILAYSPAMVVHLVHRLAAYLLLGLVVLHIAGAVFESLRTRENLIHSMITGHKAAHPKTRHALPIAAARPAFALAIVAVITAATAAVSLVGLKRPVAGAPVAMAGTDYAANCTDCHAAYHPSLLPAASWQMVMTTLDDHYGEDASIDPALADELTAWLVANAAETTDTKPAHVLAEVNPASPADIPTTPFWQATHRAIPDSRFATAPVFSKANCAACHADAAQGWFYPAAIALPDPVAPKKNP
ncbi:MAG: cytochrome b/b6 domain-containing protein [Pseudorhodobacter sp.]|nr:cytochrome b/b6 domain-containing protein [Pseudorhodobacter sp.]